MGSEAHRAGSRPGARCGEHSRPSLRGSSSRKRAGRGSRANGRLPREIAWDYRGRLPLPASKPARRSRRDILGETMLSESTRRVIATRLGDERGRIVKSAPLTVVLAYPSPYHVGMSSLGYQRIYRALMELPGVCAERAFLPDGAERAGSDIERPVTYESLRGLSDFPILAFSVAYELELAGLVRMLEASGIPARRSERDGNAPFVLAGGPLTFSNPLPLAAFADAVVMGEGESVVEWVVQTIGASPSRAAALLALAEHPNVFVPEHHGDQLAKIAACDDALLPATSTFVTPHTALSNMFLLEAERGCSRGCTYCVMRRSTNGGMRIVPQEVVLAAIPEEYKRVGLVGAAVSDHP